MLHGDQAYDDPQVVVGGSSAGAGRYFPVIDEAGAGSLQAVLDAEGNLVERVLYADAYGDAPRYLQGPVVDEVSLEIAKDDEGKLERVDVLVRVSESLVADTIASGLAVRSRNSDGSTTPAPCIPAQENNGVRHFIFNAERYINVLNSRGESILWQMR